MPDECKNCERLQKNWTEEMMVRIAAKSALSHLMQDSEIQNIRLPYKLAVEIYKVLGDQNAMLDMRL